MAVELTDTDRSFVGTGISSTYAAPIYANDDDQIMVFVNGVLKTLGDDYVLNGLGSASGISIVATFPNGSAVYVERSTPIKQEVDTQNNETILEDVIDAAFDRLTMMIQERAGETGRALLVPRGQDGIDVDTAGLIDGDLMFFDAVARRLVRVDRSQFAGKFYGGDVSGRLTPLSGSGVDAALRTDLASTVGAALVAFAQTGAPNLQSIQAKLRRTVHVDDYWQAGDPDDTLSFTRAVAALAATGGEIVLDPKKRYAVSSQITIASKKPMAIRGGNFGQPYDTTAPGIAYTAPMNSVFRVQSPATRGEAGGVWFIGLSFYDASYNPGGASPGVPGTNTIANGVLDLWDAPLSGVENCQFHFVKGSAIKTDFFVQSSIRSCRIRYCGTAGKAALVLGATDTGFASQAVTITDCRIEVCYGPAYVTASAFTQSITMAHCQFEAATVEYPASNVPYLDVSTDGFRLIGCGINRNLAQAVILRAGRGLVLGCLFETGAAATESIYCLASRYLIISNGFTDTRTAVSVRVMGINNLLVGNRFYASGGISLEGAGNQFHDNIIDTPSMLGGGYALVLADWCMARGNFFTSPGSPPAVNGVALYGNQATFTNNGCREWAGKTFIRVESAAGNAIFKPNSYDGGGTFVTKSATPLNTVASGAAIGLPFNTSLVTITGTTNIATIFAGPEWIGETVTLVFTDVLTVQDGAGNLQLAGNFATTANDTLTIACDGGNWFEVARSVN